MQAKRVRCVLPHEFSLIHLHGFLTALPRPHQCCLGDGLGLVKTASPTSLHEQPTGVRLSYASHVATHLQQSTRPLAAALILIHLAIIDSTHVLLLHTLLLSGIDLRNLIRQY